MPKPFRPADPRFSEIVRGKFADAVRRHDVAAVRVAIGHPERPIDVNVLVPSSTASGETVLFRTLGHKDTEVVDLLLAAGANVHHRNANNTTPLVNLAMAGNLLLVKRLHEAGARLYDDEIYQQPLHAAARNGRDATVAWLLQQGVPVDATNQAGRTALHEGLAYPAVLERLLVHGANAQVRDVHGRTPLALALEQQVQRPDLAAAVVVLERWALQAELRKTPPEGPAHPVAPRSVRTRL